MNRKAYIVVFGAAVKKDGTPSGAMKRRIKSAISSSKFFENVVFVVTGGVGRGKSITEAEAMKKRLEEFGFSDQQIILEPNANDTLSSIHFCTKILKKEKAQHVFVCSDTYHITRCRWLFYLASIRTKPLKLISGLQANGILKWTYYYLRELAALPFDTVLMGIQKTRKKR